MSRDNEFREAFPTLSEELEDGRTVQYRIGGIRTLSEKEDSSPVETFTPDVVDFIRRCDTVEQAIEIVEYMLKRGEISRSEAKAIKAQLKTEGVRSFGSKKEVGHYLRHGLE